MTKNAGNCRFDHITEETLNGKLHFCAVDDQRSPQFYS